jgi:hypothetical protein
MHSFNPFQKPFGEITAPDLGILKTLAEGWYAEYKQSQAGTSTIAKSISAFANTYGGWLFYGVAEDGEGNRTAGAFPGLPNSEISQYEEWLTQAVAQHLSPPAYFEHRVIDGPEQSIGLPEGRSIIVIHVPPGTDAPYVHSSGRIYRRVADASDPKHETDRHFLDLLWQRGKDTRAKFKNYLEKERPDAGEFDKGNGYLKLHFFADPWAQRGLRSDLTFRRFAEIMKNPDPIPFDSAYTSANGFVARQIINNDCWRNIFKWEYQSNCVQEITIPLVSSYIESPHQVRIFLEGYERRDGFSAEWNLKHVQNVHIVDLSLLWELLLAIFQRLYDLQEADCLEWPFWMKAQLFGIQRYVPFLDTEDFLVYIREFGFPVVQDNDAVIPSGLEPDSCIEVKPSKSEGESRDRAQDRLGFSIIQAWVTTFTIARVFGIPPIAFGLDADSSSEGFEAAIPEVTKNLIGMGRNARQVADLRFKRNKRETASRR